LTVARDGKLAGHDGRLQILAGGTAVDAWGYGY
jgi:hypothetical protein